MLSFPAMESAENLRQQLKSGVEQFMKSVAAVPLLSPRDTFARLESLGYRGQKAGRRSVALMAYRHVRRIKRIYLDGVKRDEVMPKSNYLLLGPTGCGKTHLVE